MISERCTCIKYNSARWHSSTKLAAFGKQKTQKKKAEEVADAQVQSAYFFAAGKGEAQKQQVEHKSLVKETSARTKKKKAADKTTRQDAAQRGCSGWGPLARRVRVTGCSRG